MCIDFSLNFETDTLLQHTINCKYVNVKEWTVTREWENKFSILCLFKK